MSLSRPEDALGLYVHFPWCLKKCPYCDFLSVATDRPAIAHERYADAVLAELHRRKPAFEGRRFDTVFFGGGTPSLWEPSAIGRVLESIGRSGGSGDGPGGEVTVECNPTSIDAERARELVRAGVNRLSIGVQSLGDDRLRFLGRLHDGRGGLRAVEAALAAGVPRVSADLIFGVAGQSAAEAAREAATLAELGVGHISAYALTIEPTTQFGALHKKGKLPILPDEAVADAFVAIDEALTRLGFEHYEISNYARPGARARHNVGYWTGCDYLGVGSGAWGTVRLRGRRLRYRNTPVAERYLASTARWPEVDPWSADSSDLVQVVEDIDPATALRERLLLGLRLAEGVDLAAAAAELGVDPWPASRRRAADRLIARGRLSLDGSRLAIPKEAWLFSDATIAELF